MKPTESTATDETEVSLPEDAIRYDRMRKETLKAKRWELMNVIEFPDERGERISTRQDGTEVWVVYRDDPLLQAELMELLRALGLWEDSLVCYPCEQWRARIRRSFQWSYTGYNHSFTMEELDKLRQALSEEDA